MIRSTSLLTFCRSLIIFRDNFLELSPSDSDRGVEHQILHSVFNLSQLLLNTPSSRQNYWLWNTVLFQFRANFRLLITISSISFILGRFLHHFIILTLLHFIIFLLLHMQDVILGAHVVGDLLLVVVHPPVSVHDKLVLVASYWQLHEGCPNALTTPGHGQRGPAAERTS